MSDFQFVYVRGGDKTAPIIAQKAGLLYGTRHDYPAYAEAYMVDINWKHYVWSEYLSVIANLKPHMAMVADYETPAQRWTLYSQIIALRPLVKDVMVCPKFEHALDHIPSWCLIGVSVPAPTYAGYIPPLHMLEGRRVHLLGGNPHRQYDLITKIQAAGGQVASADGNYLAMKAGHGQYFKHGCWHQTRANTVTTMELAIHSGRNIQSYLREAFNHKQPALFAA